MPCLAVGDGRNGVAHPHPGDIQRRRQRPNVCWPAAVESAVAGITDAPAATAVGGSGSAAHAGVRREQRQPAALVAGDGGRQERAVRKARVLVHLSQQTAESE